jgi:hypothetical protein
MLHGGVDKAAAFAGLGQAVNGMDSRFRQDDVDAFAHRDSIHTLYTTRVYVKIHPIRVNLVSSENDH